MERKGIFQQMFWSPDARWLTATANFQNCTPDWFPDSRHVIYVSRPANQEDGDSGQAAKTVGQKPGYGWTQLWKAGGEGKERSLVDGEGGRHIYAGAVSPDGRYVLFTRSLTHGNEDTAVVGLMRLIDAPTIEGESKALRKLHPKTKDGPTLSLGPGWEPHWTYTRIGGDQ